MTALVARASHHVPRDLSDRLAYALTRFLRFLADAFFARRYGHRAVILETVAAVPGMVGGTLRHLGSLRRLEGDSGRIRVMLDEAENERMHLMVFMQIARPTAFERVLVVHARCSWRCARTRPVIATSTTRWPTTPRETRQCRGAGRSMAGWTGAVPSGMSNARAGAIPRSIIAARATSASAGFSKNPETW